MELLWLMLSCRMLSYMTVITEADNFCSKYSKFLFNIFPIKVKQNLEE